MEALATHHSLSKLLQFVAWVGSSGNYEQNGLLRRRFLLIDASESERCGLYLLASEHLSHKELHCRFKAVGSEDLYQNAPLEGSCVSENLRVELFFRLSALHERGPNLVVFKL